MPTYGLRPLAAGSAPGPGGHSLPLEPWHTAKLDEEFRASRANKVKDLAGYLELEERLFDQLQREVYEKTTESHRNDLLRYDSGGMADPNRYGRNWSRTFEHPVDKPRAGVPLLHGLTDSPYSVQTLAGILHRHGAWVVGLRIPGHGTAPAGLTKIKWQDYAAAVRIGAKHVAEATKQLGNAASLQPDNSRYSYVHALALQKIGNTKSAMATLVAAHERDPGNRDILFALATMSRDRGDLEKAVHYANALVELSPADPGPRQLLESLQSQQR